MQGKKVDAPTNRESPCAPLRDAAPCVHRRQRNQCKECGGASFCEHGRRRSQCKECGGASFCEHGRRRSQCKECGGTPAPRAQRKSERSSLFQGSYVLYNWSAALPATPLQIQAFTSCHLLPSLHPSLTRAARASPAPRSARPRRPDTAAPSCPRRCPPPASRREACRTR